MALNTMVAVRLVVILAAIHDRTVGEERVHFRIVVPEFINTMTHTKTVYVMPPKGKSFEDSGLASAFGATGGGSALGGTYGNAMVTGYGNAAGYIGPGPGPAPTAGGYGVTASGGVTGNTGGGYGFVHPSGQGGAPRASGIGVTGNALLSYGHKPAQHISSGSSPTPPSLPVIIPLRAPPLPPPPPPGTIIVAAGHDASLSELLSHSNRVRNALRAQRFLRYNRVQPTDGITATATPFTHVTQNTNTPRLQSEPGNPPIPPELQPVYGYYGLNAGSRYQPITMYQSNSVSQASKVSKCHSGKLEGVSGSMAVQDGQGVKNGHGKHYHTVYTTPPQTSIHGNVAYVNSQSQGHGYLGNGGSYYVGFTTPQTMSVKQGQSLYNAYSALPVPPAYSALQGNQISNLNVRPTLTPVVASSGQINNAGYTTTQMYHPDTGGNYVYHGTQYRRPGYINYSNKLSNPYGAQSFSIKDGRLNLPGSPQHYHSQQPQPPTVLIKPQDYRGQRDNKHKNDKKSPVVKCRKDKNNGLVCVASANVQKNSENATKVYVGDAWTKTKHVKTKDKGIHKVNTKVKGKVKPLKTKKKKKKGDSDDKSQFASGESMSGSAEEQNVGDIPPTSDENSTPHVDPANLEAGDFSASITTSAYGAAGSDEAPEEQQTSQEQVGRDYNGDQDSQQVGRTDASDMDVEGDVKKRFRLQSDQWTPINPARLEQDDSTQDRPGEKRDTSGGKDYSPMEYHVTPAPLKTTTVVLGVTRDYKPLQAFFGRQIPAETTPAPTQISNLKYGDMYWSMVRGKVAGDDEVKEHVNQEEQPVATEAAVKLNNGLGIDEHLSLVNGWGSHIDGTEEALARPEAFPPESKPADISSEVHLTTANPNGIALYYQNEGEEGVNNPRLEIKQDEESEEKTADDEHTNEGFHLSTTLPSVSTGRFRGKIRYTDHLTTIASDEDGDLESRKSSPSDEVGEEAVEGPTEDPAEDVTEDAPEESQEEDEDTERTDKPEPLLVDELRKDIESTKENLQSALESRAKNSGPKIISETGHILRGLAVAEQLDVQKW